MATSFETSRSRRRRDRALAAGLIAAAVAVFPLSATAADAYGNHPAVEAIIANDAATVQRLLSEGLNPNRDYEFEHPRWDDGKPTRMWLPMVAAMFGRLDILQVLYAHPKFGPNKVKNTYAMCMAISHRHPEAALFLISKDVYVEPPGGCSGWFTPMTRAREQELDEVVRALR